MKIMFRLLNPASVLLCAVLALLTTPFRSSALSVRTLYNSPSTYTWVCPENVTIIQAECWGGGRACSTCSSPVVTPGNTLTSSPFILTDTNISDAARFYRLTTP